jgi:hypothetical protein
MHNHNEHLMNRIVSFMILLMGIAIFATGCGSGKPKVLDHKNFEGGVFSDWKNKESDDWIQIENKSSHDLDDVNVNVTFFGEGADQKPLQVKEHWEHWKKGEVKKITARNSDGQAVKQVQRAIGEGTSIGFSFIFGVAIQDEF